MDKLYLALKTADEDHLLRMVSQDTMKLQETRVILSDFLELWINETVVVGQTYCFEHKDALCVHKLSGLRTLNSTLLTMDKMQDLLFQLCFFP